MQVVESPFGALAARQGGQRGLQAVAQCVVLVAQGLSEIIKTWAILRGDLPMPPDGAEEHMPPELREQLTIVHEMEDSGQIARRDGANGHA